MSKVDPKCLDSFITVEEFAGQKGYTNQGIRKLIKQGRIIAKIKGKQFLIPKYQLSKIKSRDEKPDHRQ